MLRGRCLTSCHCITRDGKYDRKSAPHRDFRLQDNTLRNSVNHLPEMNRLRPHTHLDREPQVACAPHKIPKHSCNRKSCMAPNPVDQEAKRDGASILPMTCEHAPERYS